MLKIDNLSVSYGETQILRDFSMGTARRNGLLDGPQRRRQNDALEASWDYCPPTRAASISMAAISRVPLGRSRPALASATCPGREIFPQLTVAENLQVGLLSTRGDRQASSRRSSATFLFSRNSSIARGFLSGGQQQQLAIAPLVMQPQLFDSRRPTEDSANIITLIGEVLERLKNAATSQSCSWSSISEFATQLADRYYVMEKGTIVLQGDVANLDQEIVKPYLAF